LSSILGLDPMNRPLLQWEAAHLIPPATLEEAAADPRIARTTKELDGLVMVNPPLEAMHPFGATLAQECLSLFMCDVRTLALESQAHVPTYSRWLEQADMAPAYAQHQRALQALQSCQPTERWVLKTPNHLWDLDARRMRAFLDQRPGGRSVAAPTTRPTSGGRTRDWPRSSPGTPAATGSPPPPRRRRPSRGRRHGGRSDDQLAGGVT